jgi:preprotein translocase subunit SecF
MPELAHLPPKQRQKVLQACIRKYAFRHWQTWVCVFLLGIIIVIAGRYISPLGAALVSGISYSTISTVMNTAVYPDVKRYVERGLKP